MNVSREDILIRARDFFFRNLAMLVVALACGIYLFHGLITISFTGRSVAEIVVNSILAFIFGYGISVLMGSQGLQRGEMSEIVQKTMALHAKTVTSISPKIEKLDEWCQKQTELQTNQARIAILRAAGIKVEDYEDYYQHGEVPPQYRLHDGDVLTTKERAENWANLPKHKRKALARAMRLKLTPLTASVLTNEGRTVYGDPYNFGDSKASFKRKQDLRKLITRVATALLFGYYGVTLATHWDWGAFLWDCLQVGAFLLMGSVTLLTNYFWMTDTYRGRVIRKIDLLEAFRNDMQLPAEYSAAAKDKENINE